VSERRKLIEVALPLEAINKEAAREKSIRHGHPSTLHLWWARRPLAAARAVLFAQLVDDPASRPEAAEIADEDERNRWIHAQRTDLFRLIGELVLWENSTNEEVLKRARAEIMRSTDGKPPAILDPFAGGGTIPLEAQRLGLEAHASDLNPVAVLINKALIEIPPTFAGRPPVFPGATATVTQHWPRATGLAEDVRRYGAWMRDEAEKRIGHLYPKATLPDGTEATVIAWIWARTVTCPNPACGIRMPLVRSWWLGKKKGKEAYVIPEVVDGDVRYTIGHDPKRGPTKENDGTVGRTGATCIGCGSSVEFKYIRTEGQARRLGSQLIATVAEGKRRRLYLAPSMFQERAAYEGRPASAPKGSLFDWPGRINVVRYGLTTFADLFMDRQLIALTTFSDLVAEAREKALIDATISGLDQGPRLADGGTGAAAYADAVATYLAFPVSRLANKLSSVNSWDSSPKMEAVRGLFARQAIPMAWDFAEANPWGGSSGDFKEDLTWVTRVIQRLSAETAGFAVQADATSGDTLGMLLSTDPPYYDNISYADLSDFFYIWLRRSLREIHPALLSTLLVPKAEELVANPYRHDGADGARRFFESGFQEVFRKARERASFNYPITVYYAFKQSEVDGSGEASTGWETLLEGMVRGGWRITGTWPMRSELGNRMLSHGTNALASSVVLALRPRPEDATAIDRRRFVSLLRDELPDRLRELQEGSIAPVDLPQAAIGPGMAVFSRYSKVVEADGGAMTVRAALQVINQILGEVLYAQEGDFDRATRWCVKWFESRGYEPGDYGDAENLGNAYGVAPAALGRSGIVISRGGVVQLIAPADLRADYDPRENDHVTLWEIVLHLAKALDEKGLDAAGLLFSRAATRVDMDAAKELAYLLFSIAEKNRWSATAQLFNTLAASWTDVVDAAPRTTDDARQMTLDVAY
jgi:putative DNA methylase